MKEENKKEIIKVIVKASVTENTFKYEGDLIKEDNETIELLDYKWGTKIIVKKNDCKVIEKMSKEQYNKIIKETKWKK